MKGKIHMIDFIFPTEQSREAVLSFYGEFEKNGETCIGFCGYKDFDKWLIGMNNRRTGKNLPDGYVKENFYLCYENGEMIGVFSLKFELTDYLFNYGGHIGYAVRRSRRNRGLATEMLKQGLKIAKQLKIDPVLCVCDNDNYPSEKVIIKNGGVFENEIFDSEENVTVKRYWIKAE